MRVCRSAAPHLVPFLGVLLLGCFPGDRGNQELDSGTDPGGSSIQPTKPRDIQYYPIRDPNNGMIMALSPYPADWEIRDTPDGMIEATGPGGIRLYPGQVSQFFWSPDPFQRETLAMMGRQLAPVPTLEQILEQNVLPAAAAQGKQLVRTYPTPEADGFWERFFAGMAQTGSRRQWRSMGADFSDGRGTMTAVSIVQTISVQNQMIGWTLITGSFEAPAAVFADAKADLAFATGGTRINPQWQAAANGEMIRNIKSYQKLVDDMTEQSSRAHQQRMAAIQSSGSTARSAGQTYSDILDISHRGYLNRDSINSSGHSHLVDTIQERSIIGNHETGEHYNVPAGPRHYWVRDDAYYMGTDNINFNPNLDPRMNQHEWTRFVIER